MAEVKPTIAADSFSAWRVRLGRVSSGISRGTSLRMIVGDHLEGGGIADPGDEEHEHERAKKPLKSFACQEVDHAQRPAIMPMNTQKVTRAPPQRSHPAGRGAAIAPTSGPEEHVFQHVDVGKLDLGEQREAGGKADERAEGAGIEPAHQPVVLALEDHRLFGKAGLGDRRCRSCRTRRRVLAMMNGTQMKPAFCSHSSRRPWPLRIAAEAPNTPAVMTSGTTNCITLTPRLPRPALSASALPFSRLGEEEADVGHRGGEVAAAEAAQQRQHQEDPNRACPGSARHSRCRSPGSAATRWRAWSTAARRRSAP
jgi:hypothetical protein